jgi:hypothetical protein
MRTSQLLAGFAALSLLSGLLSAQQSSWVTAPTLPSKGHWVLRETAYVKRHETPLENRKTTQMLSSRLSYGLDGESAVFLDAPLRGVGRHHGPDLGDVAVGWKWRFHQENPGPVDTVRASLSLGATLPTGEERFTADELVPFAELAWMKITGKKGLCSSLALRGEGERYERALYPGETGDASLRYAGALVWRVAPDAYSEKLEAATYLTVETVADLDEGGDSEISLAAGLLYEAPSYAAEISLALPVSSDLSDRPESNGALLFGLRFLW